MRSIETTYMGLKLRNPIIIASSGLTNSVEKNIALDKAGAGAIVLKSLFEEQIEMNKNMLLHNNNPESASYINQYVQAHSIDDYIKLVSDSKKACSIPIIASINCYQDGNWIDFAKKVEEAGADAIELNIFILNTNKNIDSNEFEMLHVNILKQVKSTVNIPISVKIGQQITSLVSLVDKLFAAGANSVVLFNRFYQPDINLKTLEIKLGNTFSSTTDFSNTLRWTSIISGMVRTGEIISSNGIHDWENVVKAILVGAQAIEICSTIYIHGNDIISEICTCIELWMEQHGYLKLEEFRGKLNYSNIHDHTLFERAQFMKYLGD